jgi:predicted metal-dependent hydrolase
MDEVQRLTVRSLTVDLSRGFSRHWHGDDAFRSMYYNALSMSFPVGEQFFIDSVRMGVALLPDTLEYAALREAARQFVRQEATHRHIHGLYNVHLEKQGLVNRWERHALRRIEFAKRHRYPPIAWLAVTAGYEHCTAVFGDCTLRYPSWFDPAEPAMCTLWRWHSAEETEHKAVAFNLYQALEGGYGRRIGWYLYVVLLFTVEAAMQTALNLWRDGSLFKPRTWWSAARFFWGKDGAIWRCTGPLLAYLRRDFHPDQNQNQALAAQWLAENQASFRVVR